MGRDAGGLISHSLPWLHLLPVPPIGQTHLEPRGQGCPLMPSVEVSLWGHGVEWKKGRMKLGMCREAGERVTGVGECEMSICCGFLRTSLYHGRDLSLWPREQVMESPGDALRFSRTDTTPTGRRTSFKDRQGT